MSHPYGMKNHNYRIVAKSDGHPVRFGAYSERFEVRPGDCGVTENGHHSDCETDRERSEMDSQKDMKFGNGDEYWYRWSIYFPHEYDTMYPVHMTYGQFKQIGCDPVFSFNVMEFGTVSGPAFYAYMSSKYSRLSKSSKFNLLTQDYKGKWLDIVVHARWSHSEDGWFKVWLNGKQKVNYVGRTAWCYDGIYFKYGIYRTGVSSVAKKSKTTTIVYYDGIGMSKMRGRMFDLLKE